MGEKSYTVTMGCGNTDGKLHKHPNGCNDFLHSGDVKSARDFFEKGGYFYLIQCEKDKVEVYTRENIYRPTTMVLTEGHI